MSVHERNLPVTHLTPLTPHTFSDKDIVNNKKLYQDKYNLIKEELELFIAKLLNDQIIEPCDIEKFSTIKFRNNKISKTFEVIILTKKDPATNTEIMIKESDVNNLLTYLLARDKIILEDILKEVRLYFGLSLYIHAYRYFYHEDSKQRNLKSLLLIKSDYDFILNSQASSKSIEEIKKSIEESIEFIRDLFEET